MNAAEDEEGLKTLAGEGGSAALPFLLRVSKMRGE